MRRRGILSGEKQVVYQSVRQKKLRNKSRAKIILWSFIGLIVLVGGYLGVNSVLAYKEMSNSNNGFSTIKNLISNSANLKQTDGVTNILIMGRGGENHPGGTLTDTLMVFRLNNADSRVATVSIPRDMQVKLSNGEYRKINSAYSIGYTAEQNKDQKKTKGALSAVKTVENVTGVPIHYYIDIDFVAFKKLVDEVGGVTINVDKAVNDPLYPKDYFDKQGNYHKTEDYAPFKMAVGIRDMNGETALKFARSRETSSDFDRAKRQQQVIFALKEKMLSLGVLSNPKKVIDIMSILGDHIKTNLDAAEMQALIGKIKNSDKDKVVSKVIDNSSGGLLISDPGGTSDLLPRAGNFSQIHNFVKNIFSDSSASPTSSVKIEVYNATGEAGKAKALADKLETKGYKVAVLEKYDTVVDKSFVEDGTNGSAKKIVDVIGSILGEFKTKSTNSLNTIRIIVGRDYAV